MSAIVSHSFNEDVRALDYALSMQQLHGLAILISLTSKLRFTLGKLLFWINLFFSLGLILFCINIYASKLLGVFIFSFLTPLGGSAFIIGWLLFMTSILIRLFK